MTGFIDMMVILVVLMFVINISKTKLEGKKCKLNFKKI